MHLDARKPLEELHAAWSSCIKCELGQRRQLEQGAFVHGAGAPRGIMIIGEGPGREEEASGTPFVGRSGKLLRRALAELNIDDVCYITNVVACRSCKHELDASGHPIFRRVRGVPLPKYKDQPPSPSQIKACLPRLYEEIYLVDPLLIVSLGASATSTLLRRPVTIMSEAGHETFIEVPGVAQIPVFTDKKGVWARTVKGQVVTPTERHQVKYLCIPTLHPAYVARASADFSENSPMRKFFQHLKSAAADYGKLAEHYNIKVDIDIKEQARVEDMWDAAWDAAPEEENDDN